MVIRAAAVVVVAAEGTEKQSTTTEGSTTAIEWPRSSRSWSQSCLLLLLVVAVAWVEELPLVEVVVAVLGVTEVVVPVLPGVLEASCTQVWAWEVVLELPLVMATPMALMAPMALIMAILVMIAAMEASPEVQLPMVVATTIPRLT